MKRTAPVVEFPIITATTEVQEVIDRIKEAVGFVTSLVTIALLLSHSGIAVTAAGGSGTTVLSGIVSIDLEDCLIDDVRISLNGSHSTGFASRATIYDVTDAKELATVNIPGAGHVVSDWVQITPSAGDHRLELRIIGNGADVQTLYNVTLQGRTTQL